MGSELKREQPPTSMEEAARRPRLAPANAAFDDETRLANCASRRFDAIDPEAVPARSALRHLAAPLFVGALLAVAFARSFIVRALLPLALAAAATLLLVRTLGAGRATRARRARRVRGLELEVDRLDFHSEGAPQTLLSTDLPFGVTLVSTPRRDRAIALFSSTSGVFAVGADFDAAARRAFSELLDVASTTRDEPMLEALGPDGERLLFSAADFVALVEALAERSPSCLDRFVSSDARGEPLTLDARTLAIGERNVNLTSPLEWRSLVFQEPLGHALAFYQGTWIRQNGLELVLVSLLPGLAGPALGEGDVQGLDRGALRDLRLMQATPEQPPPAEQRVAIERLLMLPVRAALDRAPRPSHLPSRAQA